MQMIDQQGNPIDVPDDQVQAAFKSGQYGFAPGTQVPTYTSAGDVRAVPAEEFDPNKHHVATEEDWAAQQRENQYGGVGGEAAAFGIGAGNALTLGFGKGLATKAAGAFGGQGAEEATREAIKGYTETNPIASTAGEVAGTIAPLAVGGIEGLAAKGVRGVGAGVRGVDALGGLAESGVRGLVGGEAGNVVARAGQKALALGARGAVEGSLYGTGGAYSEAVLDNEDLTAERLMSGAAHGALMGGAIGAGLGAGTVVAERAIQKVADTVVPKIRDAIEDFAEGRAFKAAGGTSQWEKAAMERAGGAEEISKDLLARGHITYTSTPETIAESVARDTEETGQKLGGMMRELDAKAATEGGKLVDGGALVKRAYDDVVQPLLGNPATRDAGEALSRRLEPFVEDFAGKEVGHSRLWEIQKSLGDQLGAATEGQSLAQKGLRDFHGVLNDELVKSADQTAKDLGLSSTFTKEWKETERLYSSLSFAKEMTSDAIGGEKVLSFADKLAGGLGAMATGARHGAAELGGAHGLGILSLLHPQAALSAVVTAAAHKVLRERGSAILATAMNKLSRVGAVADQAIAVDRQVVDAVDKFLSKGTTVAAKAAADNSDRIGAQEAGVAGAAAKIFGGRAGQGRAPKSLDGQYHEATRAVAALASQPAALHEHAEKTLRPLLGQAPAMAMKVAQKQTAAIQFLKSKLPPQAVATPLSSMPVKGIPDSQKASFLRTLRAVKHPLSVVEDLSNNRLSKEGVEALKATAPETYQDFRQKVLAKVEDMTAQGQDVPYAQKLQVGRLFDAPVDPTQSPAFTKAIGQLFASMDGDTAKSPDEGGGAGPGGGKGKGRGGATARKVDTASAIETRTNELEKGLG
jgi:hypothetical protein